MGHKKSSGAESFAKSIREKLGLNKPLPQEVLDELRERESKRPWYKNR